MMAIWPRRGRVPILVAAILLSALCGCSAVRQMSSRMPPGAVVGESPDSLSDEEIEKRLAFLIERLDAGRLHAAAWQYGWLAVNAGGGIAPATQAPFDSGTDRAYDIIEAGKSAIGVTYLLVAPMPGDRGADPIRAMPDETRADRLARLARAEETLYAAANRACQRTSWLVHVGNVALNAAGGIALLALDNTGKAALSFGLDTIVGEAQIWTQPWNPSKDWEDYRRLVATGESVPSRPSVTWRLRATPRGLGVTMGF